MATTKKTAPKAKKASKQAKSRTAGSSRRKKKAEPKAKSPKKAEVTIDRRRKNRRTEDENDAAEAKPAPAIERREKVQRRRQIDPTTCERDYTEQEVEFMNAMDNYKRTSGRMFPTCSEVLEVIRDLGYVQLSSAQRTALGLTAEETPEVEEGAADEAEQQAQEAGAM